MKQLSRVNKGNENKMQQLNLFAKQEKDISKTRLDGPFILISLMPRYYYRLIVEQTKKFEYRRGTYYPTAATAFVYSSRASGSADRGLPNAEIGGIVRLAEPIVGVEDVIKESIKHDNQTRKGMEQWLKGYTAAAMFPVEQVFQIKNPITLGEMKRNFSTFQPPLTYTILANFLDQLEYLKKRSGLFE